MYDSSAKLTKSLKLMEAGVAQSDDEHVDMTTASAISKLEASNQRADAYQLLKEMVANDEDLEPSMRVEMMNKCWEIFLGQVNML